MTADEKRLSVIKTYDIILGRNYYSQAKRNYCFTKYTDGKYYSDCSSSVSHCYQKAGYSFGILNTVGMYQSKKLTDVPVQIKNGQIQNPEVLRIGDMLLFAGSDSSRAYAGYVGHVEMVYAINGNTVTLCGHGSGRPKTKNMVTYCANRYNTKADTKIGNRGLIRVRRFIQDDTVQQVPESNEKDTIDTTQSSTFKPYNAKVTTHSVNIRKGAGADYNVVGWLKKGDVVTIIDKNGKWAKTSKGWISSIYIKEIADDSSPNVSTSTNSTSFTPYRVKVTANALNIRKGAGTNYGKNGIVKKNDVLIIVGEFTGEGATKWLKLENGAGYISSDYTSKI